MCRHRLLLEPVLLALRRLAHEDVSARRPVWLDFGDHR